MRSRRVRACGACGSVGDTVSNMVLAPIPGIREGTHPTFGIPYGTPGTSTCRCGCGGKLHNHNNSVYGGLRVEVYGIPSSKSPEYLTFFSTSFGMTGGFGFVLDFVPPGSYADGFVSEY